MCFLQMVSKDLSGINVFKLLLVLYVVSACHG